MPTGRCKLEIRVSRRVDFAMLVWCGVVCFGELLYGVGSVLRCGVVWFNMIWYRYTMLDIGFRNGGTFV